MQNVSLECNQIFRTSLGVVEDYEHAGFGHVVHNTVVLLNRASALVRWYNHALSSKSEIPSQHLAEVHELLPICIWLGVGILGRVACIDSKVCAISVTRS